MSRLSGHVAFTSRESMLVGLSVAGVLYFASVSRHLMAGAFNDDAVYMVLGRALSIGAGYRSIYLVGAPVQVKYPPGLPAVLSVLWEIGNNANRVQALATAINIVACALAAGIFWWIGRVRLGLPPVLVAVFGILPFVLDSAVQYFTLVLSEPLFLLAMAGALLLYDRLRALDDAANESPRERAMNAVALGLTLAASALIRTQGVALIVALVLALAVDRRRGRESAVVAVLAIAPLAAWRAYLWFQTRHAILATQASERDYLSFLFSGSPRTVAVREGRVIVGNLADYTVLLGSYLSGWPIAARCAAVTLWVLAAAGSALLLLRHRGLSLALLANVVVLLAWPVYQDRFLLPVLPLLGLAAAYATYVVWTHFIAPPLRGWIRIAVTAPMALLGAGVVARQATIRRDGAVARDEGRQPVVRSPSFWLPGNAWFVSAVTKWTLESTQPNDRIAVASPAGLWLYTGRRTVPTEIVEPRGAPSVFDVPGRYLASHLVSDRLTVVIVEGPFSPIARDVSAVRAACPTALAPLDRFSGIAMFRARPGDACVGALSARLR